MLLVLVRPAVRLLHPNMYALVRIGLVLCLVGISTCATLAATHTAASANRADVVNALALCVNDDTLEIPAGTGTGYTSTVTVTVRILIKGAGRDSTTLVNDITTTSGSVPGLFQLNAAGCRVKDLTIQGQLPYVTNKGIGIRVGAGNIRIHHCRFKQLWNRGIFNSGINTLVDHNIFEDCWSDVGSYGAGGGWDQWDLPLGLGTTNANYGEDNYFHKSGTYYVPVSVDHGQGARGVWRFNILSNLSSSMTTDYFLDAHGNQGNVDATPPDGVGYGNSGTVYTEAYDNLISVAKANRGQVWRGGTHMSYNNIYLVYSGNWLSFGTHYHIYEEDGYRCGNILNATYPGTCPNADTYVWNDLFNGVATTAVRLQAPGSNPLNAPTYPQTGCGTSAYTTYNADTFFFQEGRDYFFLQPSTNFYIPLVYPHPRIVADNDPPLSGPFVLTFPLNGATGVTPQPTLTWTDATGEAGYRLMVSTNVFFSGRIVDTTLAANTVSYDMPALDTTTTYYWRVLSTNSNGVRSGSDIQSFSFTTGSGAVPGTIVLVTNSYSINEDSTPLVVTFRREGGDDGIVGATYYTLDNTALHTVNYTGVTNTVSWGDGDTADKTANITIIDDGAYASDKDFNLYLTNATGGATVGSTYDTANITVLNTDAPPAEPPLMGDLAFCGYEGLINSPGITNAQGWFYATTENTNAWVKWRFTVPTTTNYYIMANVVAQSPASNSSFVGISTNETNIVIDINAITELTGATPEPRPVSWVGNGTSTPQFPTNVWFLESGVTYYLFWGNREAYTYLECLEIKEFITETPELPQFVSWGTSGEIALESSGSMPFLINRTGGTNGTVSVRVYSVNGSALAGYDYNTVDTRVSFAEGVVTNYVNVTINNDSKYRGDRNFFLNLADPIGCTIDGVTNVLGVILEDDETAGVQKQTIKLKAGKYRTIIINP